MKLTSPPTLAALVLFGVASTFDAAATPIQVGLAAFGPGTTTQHFGTSGAPSFPGVTFSSGDWFQLEGSAAGGGGWGAVSEPTYNTAATNAGGITFTTPVELVGFYFGGNTVNSVPLDLALNGSVVGSFTLQTSGIAFGTPADGVNNWIFYGFYDPAGITSLSFQSETNVGWVYGIGELVYGSASSAPEPASLALLGIGLMGVAFSRRRSA